MRWVQLLRGNRCAQSQKQYGSALPAVYTACKIPYLNHDWYANLDGLTDAVLSLSVLSEAADVPLDYPVLEVEKLRSNGLFTLPGWKSFKDYG